MAVEKDVESCQHCLTQLTGRKSEEGWCPDCEMWAKEERDHAAADAAARAGRRTPVLGTRVRRAEVRISTLRNKGAKVGAASRFTAARPETAPLQNFRVQTS